MLAVAAGLVGLVACVHVGQRAASFLHSLCLPKQFAVAHPWALGTPYCCRRTAAAAPVCRTGWWWCLLWFLWCWCVPCALLASQRALLVRWKLTQGVKRAGSLVAVVRYRSRAALMALARLVHFGFMENFSPPPILIYSYIFVLYIFIIFDVKLIG